VDDSLYYAEEMMPINRNGDLCCHKAVKQLLLCGIKAGCAMTVRNRFLKFTKNNRQFDARLPRMHKLPIFFNLKHNEKQKIQQYCKEHLHELSI
jgi:hypothetical protein